MIERVPTAAKMTKRFGEIVLWRARGSTAKEISAFFHVPLRALICEKRDVDGPVDG
jgi:hypothetical protein